MILYEALKLMRPRHWVKNIFLFVPLAFSPLLYNEQSFINVCIGFFFFCSLSSAVYILNDYVDQDADRLHPVKKMRPIASGAITNNTALMFLALLFIISLCGAFLLLNIKFLLILIFYGILNLAYCFYTKNFSLFDVLSVALGFVLRVEAGASIIEVPASVWLLSCTGFIALFLAFAKRRDDVVHNISIKHRPALKGYNQIFIDIAATMSLTSVLVCYALYTNSEIVHETISKNLYLTIPFVLIGILRYMQITFVENKSGDPTHIVTSDKVIILSILSWVVTISVILLGGY